PGQALRHADDAGLARAVVHLATVARDPGDRGDAHDVAAVVHGGHERLVHPQDGEQVHVEDRAPPVGVGVDEKLVAGDAGVVHDDVEATVQRLRVLGDLLPRVVRGDVDLQGGAADAVRDLGQRPAGGRDVHAHDDRTVAGEHLGD